MSADVQRLASGQAPAPITPKVPTAAAPKTTPVPPPSPAGIVIPETPSGMGRKLVFAGVGGVILLLVIYAGVSLLGGPEPEPTVSGTPVPTLAVTRTPTPAPGRDLASYFGQPIKTLPAPDANDPFLWQRNIDLAAGSRDIAYQITIVADDPSKHPINPILHRIIVGYAEGATDYRGETAVLVFGQTEFFDSTGVPVPQADFSGKVILVVEVTNATAANQAMRAWERGDVSGDLPSDFSGILLLGKEPLVEGFSDATYRQVPVRYLNFPYADSSIDWAVVPASNNKNYLVISGSRQSIFFAIDQLLK